MISNSAARIRSALLCLLIVCVCALAAAARAQKAAAQTFHLDPATTNIHWTLNTNVHIVHGTFRLKAGEPNNFNVDPATGDASGLIVIDATSGDSADSSRDKRMHSVVLESVRYPTITFRPVHIDGKIDLATGGTVTVNGILNLHGQDHPLQVAVNLRPQAAAAAMTTHFSVPFVAWGLKDPSFAIFRTEKEVTVDVDAIASPVTH